MNKKIVGVGCTDVLTPAFNATKNGSLLSNISSYETTGVPLPLSFTSVVSQEDMSSLKGIEVFSNYTLLFLGYLRLFFLDALQRGYVSK